MNKDTAWPPPQVCQVKNGKISIYNQTHSPVHIKKNAPRVQVRTTSELHLNDIHSEEKPAFNQHFIQDFNHTVNNVRNIVLDKDNIDAAALSVINDAHEQFADVFNENLADFLSM